MEDKELFVLKSLYKRDYNAFHYLYESYFSKMVLFAESYVYDEEEAKDLVNDLFFYICFITPSQSAFYFFARAFPFFSPSSAAPLI